MYNCRCISISSSGVELANLRVRATAQEESLCQFREQQSRYKTNNHDDIEQDRMDLQLYKEKCDSLQGNVHGQYIMYRYSIVIKCMCVHVQA